ncbi:uncharacterized protein CTRU02_207958 [Colletotrichum truncatum]|uniref:Uncharacterized protein n=1 Tax=Colletotrichum truncatum TaxID=5467 RepID=A0ACC3Z2A1_COLTU
MSSTEFDTSTSPQRSETTGISSIAHVYNTRRSPSDPAAMTRKREQDDSAGDAFSQNSKAKLQKLQEKVKVHQNCAEESIRTQASNTTLQFTTTSMPGTSIYPTPALQDDPGLAVDFFMTPPDQFDIDYSPYKARDAFEGTLLNSFHSPTTFPNAPPFSPWNTLYGAYGSHEPLTPGPSCSASDMLTGFTLEDPFCRTESLGSLSTDKDAQPRLSPEYAEMTRPDSQRHVGTSGSVQNRVRHVMEQAAAVGFENLDEVLAAYYTENFEDMPSLHQEQRLSRNRRLPWLLNTLHSAAKGWSEWERRGFQEQITQGGEELLVQELNAFVSQQRLGADGNRSPHNDMGETRTGSIEDLAIRRQRVQNDLPNLWALTTALLAKADPFRQENRSDTVLAIIETLCYGRAGKPGTNNDRP